MKANTDPICDENVSKLSAGVASDERTLSDNSEVNKDSKEKNSNLKRENPEESPEVTVVKPVDDTLAAVADPHETKTSRPSAMTKHQLTNDAGAWINGTETGLSVAETLQSEVKEKVEKDDGVATALTKKQRILELVVSQFCNHAQDIEVGIHG